MAYKWRINKNFQWGKKNNNGAIMGQRENISIKKRLGNGLTKGSNKTNNAC